MTGITVAAASAIGVAQVIVGVLAWLSTTAPPAPPIINVVPAEPKVIIMQQPGGKK